MPRIGFLGTGEIASSMVSTIASDEHRIFVSERNATISAELEKLFDTVTCAPNETVVEQSEIVIICLLADVARKVLPSLPFRESQSIISVMAGVSLAEITELCKPAREVSVAIPLPILPLGGTPLVAYPKTVALDSLFGAHATIHHCASEEALKAHFVTTGLLLPLLDQIALTAQWLVGYTEDQGSAERYLAALLGGYCRMLNQSPELDLDTLRRGLSTQGGLNKTLSDSLSDQGAGKALEAGLDGLGARLGLTKRARL